MNDGSWYEKIKTPEQELAAQPHFFQAESAGGAPGSKPVDFAPLDFQAAMAACDARQAGTACSTDLRNAFTTVDGNEGAVPHLLSLQDRKDAIGSSVDTLVRNKTIAAGGDIYNTDQGIIQNLTNQQENQVAARYQLALEANKTDPNNPALAFQTRKLLTEAGILQDKIDSADHNGGQTPYQAAIQGALVQLDRGSINPQTVIPEGLVKSAIGELGMVPSWNEDHMPEAQRLLMAAYRMDPAATEDAVRLQTASSYRPGLGTVISTLLENVKANYKSPQPEPSIQDMLDKLQTRPDGKI